MGKVREHIKDDVQGLTQWIGRKLRNHNPMSARDGKVASIKMTKKPEGYKPATAHLLKDDPRTAVYTLGNGRRFKLQVVEIPAEEELGEMLAVGN